MTKKIQITGYMYIEDEEYDPGPNGPLTESLFNELMDELGLDDLRFEEVES